MRTTRALPRALLGLAVGAVIVSTGCGGDEPSATVETSTVTQTTTTQAAATTTDSPATTTTTAKKKRKKRSAPDPAVAIQRFYLAMDDDAVALDDAIGLALHGQDVTRQISRLYSTMLRRTNRWLLNGHDTSIGANLLTSAAGEARAAMKSGDQAQLVHARTTLQEGRDKLAGELVAAK